MRYINQTVEKLEYYIEALKVLRTLKEDCKALYKNHGDLTYLTTGMINPLYGLRDKCKNREFGVLLSKLSDKIWTLEKHPEEEVIKLFDSIIDNAKANCEVWLEETRKFVKLCELELKKK